MAGPPLEENWEGKHEKAIESAAGGGGGCRGCGRRPRWAPSLFVGRHVFQAFELFWQWWPCCRLSSSRFSWGPPRGGGKGTISQRAFSEENEKKAWGGRLKGRPRLALFVSVLQKKRISQYQYQISNCLFLSAKKSTVLYALRAAGHNHATSSYAEF